MLRVAARNCCGTDIRLFRQDVRTLRLPKPVDLITANFDTLNHLLSTEDLRRAVHRVFENLNPGGHFIFDTLTDCSPLGRSRAYVRRFHRHWRRVTQAVRLDPVRRLLSITMSIRSPKISVPIIERHCERVFSLEELGEALYGAGFTIRGIHDAATLGLAQKCPPRLVVVARKR
jgi:hypothetical protein